MIKHDQTMELEVPIFRQTRMSLQNLKGMVCLLRWISLCQQRKNNSNRSSMNLGSRCFNGFKPEFYLKTHQASRSSTWCGTKVVERLLSQECHRALRSTRRYSFHDRSPTLRPASWWRFAPAILSVHWPRWPQKTRRVATGVSWGASPGAEDQQKPRLYWMGLDSRLPRGHSFYMFLHVAMEHVLAGFSMSSMPLSSVDMGVTNPLCSFSAGILASCLITLWGKVRFFGFAMQWIFGSCWTWCWQPLEVPVWRHWC